jgi:hypothetical protein
LGRPLPEGGWSPFPTDLCCYPFHAVGAPSNAVKAFYAKEHALEADVGNKYASFRIVGIEGIEQK